MLNSVRMLGAAAMLALGLIVISAGSPAQAQSLCGSRVDVRPGDTLSRIAARCGTTVTAILRMNPQITNPNVVHLGQVIRLAPGPVTQPAPPYNPGGGSADYYVVRPGDTFYRISVRVGVSLPALLALNRHIDPRFLRPGMRIRLPGGIVIDPYPQPPRPPAGIITVSGTLTGEGITCPALRGSDGRLYTLAGDVRGRPGDRVRVEGRIVRSSICMQGTTLEVRRIRIVERDHGDDDGPGLVRITGVVTDEGVECTAVRDDDGRLYTLAGAGESLRPGDRVEVVGRRAEVSFCMQGTTIEVERLRRLGSAIP